MSRSGKSTSAKKPPVPRKRKLGRSGTAAGGSEKDKYWSGQVTRESNALDLEPGVFEFDDPLRIARSLQNSAETSTRRKAGPYQSAMSMLNFYINRAGRNLSAERRQVLSKAKEALRRLYGRT